MTFHDQLLKIVEDYRAAGQPWPATREQMAEWAVANERYQLTRGMAVRQCAERISHAMSLEHVKDKKGRSVRKYYAARVRENGQLVVKWDDLNSNCSPPDSGVRLALPRETISTRGAGADSSSG